MNWISALHLETVLAEQAEQRRRISASWGPLWTPRVRRPGPGTGSVVRLPAARRAEHDTARRAGQDPARRVSHPAA